MLCASVGTALLVFVPSAAWLRASDGAAPFSILRAYALKQVLTVSLLLIVPALWTRCTQVFGLWTLPALALLAFGVGYALSRDVVTALYGLLLVGLPGVALYVFERIRLSNFRAVIYESFFVLFALFGAADYARIISDTAAVNKEIDTYNDQISQIRKTESSMNDFATINEVCRRLGMTMNWYRGSGSDTAFSTQPSATAPATRAPETPAPGGEEP